jgi:hypothetical protein
MWTLGLCPVEVEELALGLGGEVAVCTAGEEVGDEGEIRFTPAGRAPTKT